MVIIVGILFLVYRYRCANNKCDPQSCNDPRNYDEEKTNNLQNEDTFRRFANPLKDSIIVCSQDVASPVSVVDLTAKINVVRPISHTSNAEMMEMISDAGPDCSKSGKCVSTKVLLSKTQNSTFQKCATLNAESLSTLPGVASKEYNYTKPLNVNVIPSSTHRTSASPSIQSQNNNNNNDGDNGSSSVFATVLV